MTCEKCGDDLDDDRCPHHSDLCAACLTACRECADDIRDAIAGERWREQRGIYEW